MTGAATYTLPKPLSVNHMFKNARRGRVMTPKYAAWKREAALMLMSQKARPLIGPYSLEIGAPVSRRGDIDNVCKCLLDALQAAGVLSNDNLVDELTIRRIAGTETTVTVTAIGEAIPHQGRVA